MNEVVPPAAKSDAGHVVIVIVAFRNVADIRRCLEALERITHRQFTVYICENGGDAAFAALSASVPQTLAHGQKVVLINAGDNLGYAGGINLCLDRARNAYEAAWILNPDTEPEPGALAALLARVRQDDVEAAGSMLVGEDGGVQGYAGRWRPWFATGASIGLFAHRNDPVDVAAIEARQNYLMGASMLVSRTFVEKTGPMQADYFLYAEEVEWCLRAQRRGLKLGFAPDSVVTHHMGTTTGWAGAFNRRPRLPIYLDARNRVRLTAKMYPWCLPTAVPYMLLHSLWRYARRGAWRQVAYVCQGVFAGLRGEAGRPAWIG